MATGIYRKVLFSLFIGVLALARAATAGEALDRMAAEFKSPPPRYGGAPFWSWNEKLIPSEMETQIDELADGGMCGFFMHAREGLITGYLSDEWMDAVRLSVGRAKEKGMLAYLYDEDRWPSGFAGGKVTAIDPEFRQKALLMVESAKPLGKDEIGPEWRLVRVFEARRNGNALESYRDVTPAGAAAPAAPAPGASLLYLFRAFGVPREWFNNSTYIDTMDPAAVDAFIETTYEEYKRVVGDEFGKTVPAIFTDEPCFHMNGDFPKISVPWTDALPDYFSGRYGYDVRDFLPELFFANQRSKKTRLDFWTAATEMFRDSFGKRLYEWCDRNGVEFTGHYMAEDTLHYQIEWIGAAMPQYEYMHIPGMDHLGRNIDNPLTAKQVSSAAHQFGRPLALTETYGCSGWNVSLEDMKWMSDWHYALGVNFMNEHLSWYTMRGERKRDYPASIHYQSPWWKHHRALGDYVRRATWATSRGRFVADALLLHPMTSAWAVFSPLDESETIEINASFVALMTQLTANQVDYDLGDEIIISRHGRVDGARFIVGDMAYSAVVIPPGVTLRSTTVALLEKFIAAGGRVIAVEPAASLVDAEKPLALSGASVARDRDDALAQLLPLAVNRVDVKTADGAPTPKVFVHQRDVDGERLIFLANTDRDTGVDVDVALPLEGGVRAWNLFTGEVVRVSGYWSVKLRLEPAGSALLSVTPGEPPIKSPTLSEPRLTKSVEIPDNWTIAAQDSNALTIDFIALKREGDAAWTTGLPWNAVRDALNAKGPGTKFSVRYAFNLGFDPKDASELFLVMEQPDKYEITVNGLPVGRGDSGWWRDRYFRKIDIRGLAVEGRNEIEASAVYQPPKKPGTRIYTEEGIEVEAVYIVGGFAVKSESGKGFVLLPPLGEVKYGDLAKRGFPFFSGSITLARNVELPAPAPHERIFLEIDGLKAITAAVTVNGAPAGLIAFHPHRVEITSLVRAGANRVEIELTNSNRNLLGPHHGLEAEPLSVGPGDFTMMAVKKHQLVPFGIAGGVRVVFYR